MPERLSFKKKHDINVGIMWGNRGDMLGVERRILYGTRARTYHTYAVLAHEDRRPADVARQSVAAAAGAATAAARGVLLKAMYRISVARRACGNGPVNARKGGGTVAAGERHPTGEMTRTWHASPKGLDGTVFR
eukprot:gene12999-biopygen12524